MKDNIETFTEVEEARMGIGWTYGIKTKEKDANTEYIYYQARTHQNASWRTLPPAARPA